MEREKAKTTPSRLSEEEATRVCVTGAGGFAASWLVKLLLSRGGRYIVHGTVRDPGDDKNSHLMKLDGASTNLHLFKADLLDYESIVTAVAGCEGVFHVASPLPAKISDPEAEVLVPAISGTLNVLKACSEAKVKRVVVVSSGTAVYMNPNFPTNSVLNEDCWSDEEYLRTIESWYRLAKTIAERTGIEYAAKNGLNVVTVCPTLIFGPLLQPAVNTSSLALINMLNGVDETIKDVSRHIVDVRDVASALLLLYETPDASGRYICSSCSIKSSDLINLLKGMYPHYNYPKNFIEADTHHLLSTEKLKRLGWTNRPLEETLRDSVEFYRSAGLLPIN